VWAIGLVGLVIVALVADRILELAGGARAGESDAYLAGEFVGRIIGALLVAAALRWLSTRMRGGGRILSPWLIAIAAIVLLAGAAGTAVQARPVASLPAPSSPAASTAGAAVSGLFRITAPYSFRLLGPDSHSSIDPIVQQLEAAGARDVEAREIVEAGEIVGWAVIFDWQLGAGSEDEYVDGFLEGAPEASQPERVTIRGRPVGLLSPAESGVAGWADPPLAVTVFAVDLESARVLAKAMLAAGP
jgi:hypothetical protein